MSFQMSSNSSSILKFSFTFINFKNNQDKGNTFPLEKLQNSCTSFVFLDKTCARVRR